MPFGRVTTVALNGIEWQRSQPPTPPYTFELATRVWVTPEPVSTYSLVIALGVIAFVANRRRPPG